jgi:hypothetical protein
LAVSSAAVWARRRRSIVVSEYMWV